MNTPAGLVAIAVLFWGWQTGLLPLAGAIALVLEGARLVPWRWDLSRADFYRVADLCRVVAVGMGVYLFSTYKPARAVWGMVQWFPLAVLPLVVCQALSLGARIDVWVFLLIVRRRATEGERAPRAVNLAYPYVALTLLAASAANVRTPAFYAAVLALGGWALWTVRARAVRWPVWVGLFLLVGAAGYAGHVTLYRLQRALEGRMLEWFYADRMDPDPYRSTTALGRIGQLKLSDRIVLRVTPDAALRPPFLLREASYDVFSSPIWGASDLTFATVRPEADALTWKLDPAAPEGRRVTIATYLKRGKGVLPLPNGASRLERLYVVTVKRSALGAVKVEEGLGLITYQAAFGPAGSRPLDAPPTPADLRLPTGEAPLLGRLAGELGLAARSPEERLAAVAEYFRRHFRYTSYLSVRGRGTSALEDFLVRTRAGHCEYFATATVLLLRAGGVPARYAVGYSVQEWSGLEAAYVARARHAHSWALAWVDGGWRDVDTTPPAWFQAEQQDAAWWEPVSDLWAWAVFVFSRWRWSQEEGGLARYLGWLLVPLVGFLAWRLRFRRHAGARAATRAPAHAAVARRGTDSEFYAIERRIGELGFPRGPSETLVSWVARLRAARPEWLAGDGLDAILALHSRYRFDPHGLSPAERERLRAAAAAWLQSVPPSP